MSGQALLKQLEGKIAGLRGRMQADALMSKLTWFQVGGPADILFQPADEADLAYFMQRLPDEIPVTIVGVGSNLLVRDSGIEGVVIRLSQRGFGQVEQLSDTRLLCGAAVLDKKLAAKALDAGLGGFEFYHGIPGAIGGALRMNAGANTAETTNRLIEAVAIDRKGERHVLSHGDMGYSYRHSSAPLDLIFTNAVFEGFKQDAAKIQAEMEAVQQHRESVQPVKEKTGGSTFKNPHGQSAWKLIDDAGLRGFKVGDAQMSEMHCNFMINCGTATARDLESLGESVRQKVHKHSGVLLDWEIQRIGRFEAGKSVQPYKA